MIIFPAIDLQFGNCVRLRQGKADDSTIFSDKPVRVAEKWQEQGASWLHVIDLNGAFDGAPVNLQVIHDICKSTSLKVQVGGGIRDLETVIKYFDAGVERVIIGTVALDEPDIFASMCKALPGRIGVSLDANKGHLRTKGWVENSGLTVKDVLPRLVDQGASFIIYTDIERDGMQQGTNIEEMTWLAKTSPIPVIAAGGVTALADIRDLYPLSLEGKLEGAITGRAIYEGTLKLSEALAWIEAQKKMGNPSVYKD